MAIDYNTKLEEKYPEFFISLPGVLASGHTVHQLFHFWTDCDTFYRTVKLDGE